MSLYFAGKDAYNSGNYEAAQKHFQEALVKDENIEAKAQNIKYMLGVSAFNNQDYKTAITYLSLFSDNPIAQDLLSKIKQYETTLPEDFLYHNDNSEQKAIPDATSVSLVQDKKEEEGETKQKTTIIIIVTTLTIMALSVFFEIKRSLFSRMALKLVGVSSDTIVVRAKSQTETKPTEQITGVENEEVTNNPEHNTASLIETPFDEEIDIDEMASKDIKEISRFFDELTENTDSDQNVKSQEMTNNEENSEVFDNARDSILNSLLDDEDTNELELQEADEGINNEQPQSEPIETAQTENVKPEEISKKPKYEHLDNVPDDFNVNLAIEKAFNLIKKSSKAKLEEDQENEEFKSIEELEKELDEKEKINLNYFQEMEEIDDDSLKDFFDYIFEKHTAEL